MTNTRYVGSIETVDHLLSGCKKLVGTEYVKRHNNIFESVSSKMGYRKWTALWRYKMVYKELGTQKSDRYY